MALQEFSDPSRWELVLPDGTRRPLTSTTTIGRAPENDLQLADRTVSRHHARLELWPDGPLAIDAGSTYGTFVDGRRVSKPTLVKDGGTVRVGEVDLVVERVRGAGEAGRTLLVETGATVFQQAVGGAPHEGEATADEEATAQAATHYGMRPRVRSGWALKRLDASEGERRFILKDLRSNAFVRMTAGEAELFELLDGTRSLVDLIAAAEQKLGPTGPSRLASLLADLGDRGLLAGVDGTRDLQLPGGRLARMFRPREYVVPWAGPAVDAIYRKGGRFLVTRQAGAVFLAIAVAGVLAFGYLIARRYGTPFVVAAHVGLGGAVFLAGRFVLVALHELAHGIAVAACGRHVHRAGIKLVAVFPYGFVDTSDAWFEPRRRRLLITGAGPISDFTLGGIFAISSLALGAGTMRDICFQLAFGAYVGAFTNLNPVLDRDGYQLLVDALREPGLRQRSRAHLRARLAGKPTDEDTPRAVRIYALLGIVWMVLGALFVLVLASRYYDLLVALSPREWIVWALFGGLAMVMFAPVLFVLGRGLYERRQQEPADGLA